MSATEPYIVKGASEGNFPRLELEELMKDEYQWSLFAQAMANLQKKGYRPEPASWQAMAGIHGLPYSRWSGDPNGPPKPSERNAADEKDKSEQDTRWLGYCYHSSVLFPTWHRMYMLLVEQAVTDEAKRIVEIMEGSTSPEESGRWKAASVQLRFPYWDWSSRNARNLEVPLPLVFMEPEIKVRGPNATIIPLLNPLNRYELNPIPEGATDNPEKGVFFATWERTYRWAKEVTRLGGPKIYEDDNAKLNKALSQGLIGHATIDGRPRPSLPIICDKLRRMFSFPVKDHTTKHALYWDHFSNTAPQGRYEPSESLDLAPCSSLESPHNSMHLDIGGNGDMGYNEMAGFDPIFYLHHCNVDRLLALWEYVYPDYWVGQGYYNLKGEGPFPFYDQDGTWQTGIGAVVNEDSPLAPFHRTGENYWTSLDVRGLRSGGPLGYTYPPMRVEVNEDTEVVIDITKPADLAQRKRYIGVLQSYYGDKDPIDSTYSTPARPALFSVHPGGGEDTKPPPAIRSFSVTAYLPELAHKGSHRFEISLAGQVVNETSVFSRLDPTQCENCARRAEAGRAYVRGVMGLPHSEIVRVLELEGANRKDTSDEEVVEAIHRRLTARIVAPDGSLLAEPVSTAAEAAALAADPELAALAVAEEHRPTLRLWSVLEVATFSGGIEPITLTDLQDHGKVLDLTWRRART